MWELGGGGEFVHGVLIIPNLYTMHTDQHSPSRVTELQHENSRLKAELELIREDLRNARDENMALRMDIRRLMERRFAG